MLIEEYRSEVLENFHIGRICVVDESGRIIASVGDANAITYFRSAAKPFQLLPLFLRGIDKKYGLTTEEMTVCAASHLGEDIHISALESIMKKADLKESDLVMLPTVPGHPLTRENFIREKMSPRKLYHNCSGKHLALMLLERELCGDHKNYWKLESHAQREIIETISVITEYPKKEILCGIDGCGVPVFAVPQRCISLAFMKLANPKAAKDNSLEQALNQVADCFCKYPYMTRGHGQLCGELNSIDNFVAKIGAEAVYGLGLKNEKLGISIKISDGSANTLPIIIAEILSQLGYKDEKTYALLSNLKNKNRLNDNNDKIGYYKPVFRLV